ncbi:MAG: NADH-ubiquinone oxidoreductase-F iron-sulfur binding region domain-containing protein [Armatimonadota bacterium]
MLLVDWLVSNPPSPAVLAVSFTVVALLAAFVGYRSGVVQVAARLDATELPEHRAPSLYRRLHTLTSRMDIEPPTVLLADLGAPNALSVGGPKRGAVVLDRRLLTLLNHDELEAIVAHELAHMEGYDTFLNTLALTVIRLLVSVVFVLALPFVVFLAGVDRAGAWIVGDPRRPGFGLSELFQRLVAFALLGLLSVVTILFLANSRRQEYRADERAGEVTGKPAALARALTKIHRATDPRRGLYSPLYIHDDPRSAMLVDGLKEVANAHPDMRISIEYKPYEPRQFYFISDIGTALLAIEDTGCDNLGVTLDFAHMLMKKENPAFSAGFPTGLKWEAVRNADSEPKFIICNGDEGDPGAFMDRMILESYPFRVLEGMIIGAYAAGVHDGLLYIRAEYPLAVQRMWNALAECRERGYLGEGILGSGFDLQLGIREGAGAFVCGEESALIASIEGDRGTPRLRPPYPADSGLWGRPTLINNVETWAVVPWIIREGADKFASMGTERSKGTKVFALAGKVDRGGLIEVPMGITIREIVEEIGGGVADGREFKAVQIGGPSGGCIPERLADTPVDYEALAELGAIMGSGGFVVLDDNDCMVDVARYFLEFTQRESCGKCVPCRIGTRRMLEILERIATGEGRASDLDTLQSLGAMVRDTSLCALGGTAPNPVLTTLEYFREEYEAHIDGRCPAGVCKALIRYEITDECIGCTLCSQACPADAIPMRPHQVHEVDQELCVKCGTCVNVCPVDAVDVRSEE